MQVLETEPQALAKYHKMRQYATKGNENHDINKAALVIQRWWKAYRKRSGAQQLFNLSDSLQANLVSAMTMNKQRKRVSKKGSVFKQSRTRGASTFSNFIDG